MFRVPNGFARAHIQTDRVNQCFLGSAIHFFVRGEPIDAMTNAGGGNRRQCKPGTLVRAGCAQPLGAERQLGTWDSVVADDSHAQSMAEPQINGAEPLREFFSCRQCMVSAPAPAARAGVASSGSG